MFARRPLHLIQLSFLLLLTPTAAADVADNIFQLEERVRKNSQHIVSPPFAGEAPGEHGPVFARGTLVEVKSFEELEAELRAALLYTPPCIRMKPTFTVGRAHLERIANLLHFISGVRCTECRLINDELQLRFEYDEGVRLMSMYRRYVDNNESAWNYNGPVYDLPSYNNKSKSKSKSKNKSVSKRSNKDIPSFDNLRDLCCYVMSAMPCCPTTLQFQYTGKLSQQEKDVLNLAIRAYTRSIGYKHMPNCIISQEKKRSYITTLNFGSYDGYELLYAAYCGYVDKSRLTDQQQKVLPVITQWVEEIQEEHVLDYHRARAAHDKIVLTCAYRKYKSEDSVSDMVQKHHGKCSHYALLYSLMVKMMGINSLYINGNNDDGDSHAWNVVYLDGIWGHVDCTWDDPVPNVKNRLMSLHFMITDAERDEKLTWNTEKFPQCEDETMTCRARFDKQFDTVSDMLKELLAMPKDAIREARLEACVAELSNRPERVFRLVQKACSEQGCSTSKLTVDYTESGEVTLIYTN